MSAPIRMLAALLLACLSLCPLAARADYPAVVGPPYSCIDGGGNCTNKPDLSSAQSGFLSWWQQHYNADGIHVCNFPWSSASSGTYVGKFDIVGPGCSGYQRFSGTWICPYGGTPSGTTCAGPSSCPSGQVLNSSGTACVSPPSCPTGSQDLYFFGPAGSAYLPESTCYNGCSYNQGSGVGFYDSGAYRPFDGATGAWHADYLGTGSSCTDNGPATGSGDTSSGKPAPSCPSGQSVGTVNGVTGCYPSGKPNTTTTTSSTDAAGNTTQVTNVTNVTGSTTTTTTISNAGGSSTTTTSSPGSGGTAGDRGVGSGAGGTVTPQDKTCADNPTLAGCAGSGGVFGGPPAPAYTPKDATFGNAISTFKDQVSGSGLGLAAVAFFNVQASGSCPTWTAQVPYLNYTIVFDYFCQDWATSLYPLIGAAMLVVFAWVAFTIAIL